MPLHCISRLFTKAYAANLDFSNPADAFLSFLVFRNLNKHEVVVIKQLRTKQFIISAHEMHLTCNRAVRVTIFGFI